MLLIENVISEYLKRYEQEATSIIEGGHCSTCCYKTDNCFPCPVFNNLLPQVEEVLVGRSAKEN